MFGIYIYYVRLVDCIFLISIEVPIKPSNIRIWIHECNIKQLSKVIWSGQGDKLLTETSKQTTVNKFLKAVPYIMVTSKCLHFCRIFF